MSDTAQWFEPLGLCRCGCGKLATGKLNGYNGNSFMGYYTVKCAEKRIKACHKKGQHAPDCYASKERL